MIGNSPGVPQVVVNVAESPLLVVLEGKATKKYVVILVAGLITEERV